MKKRALKNQPIFDAKIKVKNINLSFNEIYLNFLYAIEPLVNGLQFIILENSYYSEV